MLIGFSFADISLIGPLSNRPLQIMFLLNSPDNIISYKKNEVDAMFEEQSNELDRIGRQKEELNKLEETIRYELSGLHGARVVLDQLLNENSVKTKQENEEK